MAHLVDVRRKEGETSDVLALGIGLGEEIAVHVVGVQDGQLLGRHGLAGG